MSTTREDFLRESILEMLYQEDIGVRDALSAIAGSLADVFGRIFLKFGAAGVEEAREFMQTQIKVQFEKITVDGIEPRRNPAEVRN